MEKLKYIGDIDHHKSSELKVGKTGCPAKAYLVFRRILH